MTVELLYPHCHWEVNNLKNPELATVFRHSPPFAVYHPVPPVRSFIPLCILNVKDRACLRL